MKKKDLEIELEAVLPFKEPVAALEQYSTPSVIASDILFTAYCEGNVADRVINDLGCGTGIFAIGSCLLNAKKVYGYDISRSALDIARKNIEKFNADVELIECDISEVKHRVDTTFMNPPFGCQTKRADRPFLDKAMELSSSIYSIHMENTLPFVEAYVASKGHEIVSRRTYKYNISHTFTFHSKAKKSIDIVVVNIR